MELPNGFFMNSIPKKRDPPYETDAYGPATTVAPLSK